LGGRYPGKGWLGQTPKKDPSPGGLGSGGHLDAGGKKKIDGGLPLLKKSSDHTGPLLGVKEMQPRSCTGKGIFGLFQVKSVDSGSQNQKSGVNGGG